MVQRCEAGAGSWSWRRWLVLGCVLRPASKATTSGGGVAWRLDDAWSVGVSAQLWQRTDATTFATRSYAIGVGDFATLGSGSVPTVRWLANNVLSLELWASASARYVVEDAVTLVYLGAVVTATGHFF